jgi:hypothetical protein
MAMGSLGLSAVYSKPIFLLNRYRAEGLSACGDCVALPVPAFLVEDRAIDVDFATIDSKTRRVGRVE